MFLKNYNYLEDQKRKLYIVKLRTKFKIDFLFKSEHLAVALTKILP